MTVNRGKEIKRICDILHSVQAENVFDVLQNNVIRHDFISYVPENQKDNMNEYILTTFPDLINC